MEIYSSSLLRERFIFKNYIITYLQIFRLVIMPVKKLVQNTCVKDNFDSKAIISIMSMDLTSGMRLQTTE